jgi:hypothetical protein
MTELFRDKIGNTDIAVHKDNEGYYIQFLHGVGYWFYCKGTMVKYWKTEKGIKKFIARKKSEGML